jgi:hypothetical protein
VEGLMAGNERITLGGCDLVLDDPFAGEGQAYVVGGDLGVAVCALKEFEARDRRRIKREVNKAVRKYRRENPESVERWNWNG